MAAVDELITEHIDIWTSAVKRRSGSGRGGGKKVELYGVKKLRELILDLAVRGLLVPQDPEDEPVGSLLETIHKERTWLEAEGKAKKQKKIPPIDSGEEPNNLPSSWQWVRLGSICILENGDRSKNYPNKSLLVDSGIPFVNAGHLLDGQVNRDEMTFITRERYDLLKAGKFRDGDILFCLRGSLGKSALVEGFDCGAIASSLVIVRRLKETSQEYLQMYFNSPLSFRSIQLYDNGTAQPNLSAADLGKFLVPLPPLPEQHRIVAKVDELMALCDQLEQQTEASLTAHQTLVQTLLDALTQAAASQPDNSQSATDATTPFEQAWNRLSEHFDTVFTTEDSIEQLKQTILQLAVMGKLVPQDPNDEPASVLLERIAAEKAELVKAKKIKKQKALPEIGEDEKPFALPSGWGWSRLGDLGYDLGGGTPSKSKKSYWDGDIPWVSPKDMKTDYIVNAQDYVTEQALSETTVKLIPENSLLLVVRGMILAHSFPVAITKCKVVINQDMKALIFGNILPSFLLLQMKSSKSDVVQLVDRSSHGTCKLISDKLWNIVIPVPPFNEQHRIVLKVSELMIICDQLKTRLTEAQATRLQIADAVAEQAIH